MNPKTLRQMLDYYKPKQENDTLSVGDKYYTGYEGVIPTFTGSTGYSERELLDLKERNPEMYKYVINTLLPNQVEEAKKWHDDNMYWAPFIKFLLPEMDIDRLMINEKAEQYRILEDVDYHWESKQPWTTPYNPSANSAIDSLINVFEE